MLLFVVGALLGINFPLGKIALAAGVPSLVWAALISAGGAAVLGLIHAARRRPTPMTLAYGRYFTITAIVSYAVPNTLILLAIPQLGSGLTAIFYTLSPFITVALSRLAGLRAPRRLEYAGIAIGFAGALLVASARGEVGRPAEWMWLALGFLIPLSLATGNVYRSLAWPKGADPAWLAIGSHAVATALLVLACLLTGTGFALSALLAIPLVVIAQITASAALFVLYFRLQAVGGPVTLSQIGTVAAGVAIVIGAGILGERYPLAVWAGVALILLGIGLTVMARRKG